MQVLFYFSLMIGSWGTVTARAKGVNLIFFLPLNGVNDHPRKRFIFLFFYFLQNSGASPIVLSVLADMKSLSCNIPVLFTLLSIEPLTFVTGCFSNLSCSCLNSNVENSEM